MDIVVVVVVVEIVNQFGIQQELVVLLIE